MKLDEKAMWILVDFTLFRDSIQDISGFRGWIMMQDSVLETLLVVDYMTEI